MAYEYDSRTRPQGAYRYNKSNDCSFGQLTYVKALPLYDATVYSWRGPLEFVKVGRKRRAVFRTFQVNKYIGPEMTYDEWCPRTGVCWAGEYFSYSQFYKRNWTKYKYGSDAWSSGSSFPRWGLNDFDDLYYYQRQKVIDRLYRKLYEPRFNGATFLAELGETLTGVKSLLVGAKELLVKRGALWSTIKHFSLNTEELWLWYRYALLPAMLDAEDLLKAIKPEAQIDRYKAGMSKKYHKSKGVLQTFALNGMDFPPMKMKWEQNVEYRAGGAIDISKRIDTSQWGMSAEDMLAGTWEIIPFSFIFDWFVDVGGFLTTLRDVHFELEQSYATCVVDSTLSWSGDDTLTVGGKPSVRRVFIDRAINVEPSNTPLVNKEVFNINRTIDSITLTVGILKSILSKLNRRRRR